VLLSDHRVGPGGGRNRMVAAASHEIVASFDDDSYPIDRDYFERVRQLFARFADAWVVDSRVFHLSQPIEPDTAESKWVADFSGGGCAYRRERYLQTGGYVPLPTAYGMEEVDFSLRLHALGGRVLRSGSLRVFHDTDLAHHADPAITSASIVNLALLTYLRYPFSMWAVGAAQCANRIQWLLRHGRRRGVWNGLISIPSAIAKHRGERDPLPGQAVRSYLTLRRAPRPA
jgi:GT2 family glycosyltransferase